MYQNETEILYSKCTTNIEIFFLGIKSMINLKNKNENEKKNLSDKSCYKTHTHTHAHPKYDTLWMLMF